MWDNRYLEKYGRVRMPPCRDMLLKTMAQCMASLPVSKGATIVPHVIEDRGTAFYGEAMYHLPPPTILS